MLGEVKRMSLSVYSIYSFRKGYITVTGSSGGEMLEITDAWAPPLEFVEILFSN